MSSSPNGNEPGQIVQTQFSFPSPTTTTNSNEESYSSMISNFVTENLVKTSKFDEDETFDRRPLLDLISELNRRHTLNQSPIIHPHEIDQSNERRTVSPTPSDVLPPKSLSPFRPVIVHKKYQVNKKKHINIIFFLKIIEL